MTGFVKGHKQDMDAEKGNLAYTNYGTDVYSAPTPPPPYEPGNIQNPVDKGIFVV